MLTIKDVKKISFVPFVTKNTANKILWEFLLNYFL